LRKARPCPWRGQLPLWRKLGFLSREGLFDFALRIGEREVVGDLDYLLAPLFGEDCLFLPVLGIEALRTGTGPPFSWMKRLENSVESVGLAASGYHDCGLGVRRVGSEA
jgi:hypothetical protein